MHRLVLVVVLPLVAVLALLQGCSKPTECPEATPVIQTAAPTDAAGGEFYNCTSIERADSAQETWCEARNQFDQSAFTDADAFKGFLKGYRNGINDSRQAKDSRYPLMIVETNQRNVEEAGYRSGYNAVLKAQALIEYDCSASDNASEFKDRWCEASDSFRASGMGDNNAWLKGRFIDGYMAGGRVALTVPTSMESFFNGENPEGKQPAIAQPEDGQQGTGLAFYRGFDEGYKAMITSIRESINQVMEQMQIPNNLELPEGMMPPQPDSGQ